MFALFFALTAYIIKGEFKTDTPVRLLLALFFITITILSIWYLFKNSDNIRGTCQLIVKVESLLGLYEPTRFWEVSTEDSPNVNAEPTVGPVFFPKTLKTWGKSDTWLSLTPHVITVILSCLFATVVIFLH